jgi:V8-like Glu-specific endopeptidase
MQRHAFLLFALLPIMGCGDGAHLSQGMQDLVIGPDNRVVVNDDGTNVPEKYRPLLDAFGIINPIGCTATHVGDGIVLTAGHCFRAPKTRVDQQSCGTVATVDWGVRGSKAAYLTSKCSVVLAEEHSASVDYAIFRVTPAPSAKVQVDLSARPPEGTPITLFGHPFKLPLRWSPECAVHVHAPPASEAADAPERFFHECATDSGNSGSTVISVGTLAIVGIHDAGVSGVAAMEAGQPVNSTNSTNIATYVVDTPISEFLGPSSPSDPGVPAPDHAP